MKTTVNALLRDDLRTFAGYQSARTTSLQGEVWLNANESAWANATDDDARLRRYPQPQPQALRECMAQLYAVAPEQLLIGRGSDEAIDLLVRAFCAPGQGRIVIATPVFGMYAVCAKLHGASIIDVPLVDSDAGLCVDVPAMGDAALTQNATLLFLCSPGNPSGELLSLEAIATLAQRLRGRCMVVVDEAYLEYADAPSATALLSGHDNIAVLRTLSKAHALAAARVGCVIGSRELIDALRRCQAPYPVPQPVAAAALAALAPQALASTTSRIGTVREARQQLQAGLLHLPAVRRVYASAGNFLLVRFVDTDAAFAALLAAGVVVRDMRAMPQLGDALRITVGTQEECSRVLAALEAVREVAA
ncbi:histidinol-phosphate transaminase [Thermomonas sp.]|jgi:histidinol-phosphate aminotransferase|uniref:histidinol-phosphate transaminase n=1 Tax=Thermomonas sp. TaxID=1971895 RepID=UPI00259486AF|nr:histidinol-phosphate transaminase [Thermomonas sp.]MBS0459367.1 histidinol-phosphate transaminase [Pseudomonadota bacterium]HOC11565.1 histidinol-phosphate transaminase [Thermomonas sp.]HQA02390.1 histidinol-phosphate transaminase [Thermomonas sp.]HQE06974.1 histidinol-phosphate transaminase [Thermomonas sp.]